MDTTKQDETTGTKILHGGLVVGAVVAGAAVMYKLAAVDTDDNYLDLSPLAVTGMGVGLAGIIYTGADAVFKEPVEAGARAALGAMILASSAVGVGAAVRLHKDSAKDVKEGLFGVASAVGLLAGAVFWLENKNTEQLLKMQAQLDELTGS